MTCREFVEFLNEYLSGELPESALSDFEGHLAHCVNCAAYLKTYRETIRLARSVCSDPEGPIPEGVPEGLIQAILEVYARKE